MDEMPTRREYIGALTMILFPLLVAAPFILLSLYGYYLLRV